MLSFTLSGINGGIRGGDVGVGVVGVGIRIDVGDGAGIGIGVGLVVSKHPSLL